MPALVVIEGLERKAEAVAMLEAAHETLLAAFGEEYEPVSEAMFYLTLARLPLALNPEALQSVEERMTLVTHFRSFNPRWAVSRTCSKAILVSCQQIVPLLLL